MPEPLIEATEFQFHSGLIKSNHVLALSNDANLFQFHSGLIKRGLEGYEIYNTYMFQFHSGLIKSQNGKDMHAISFGFNSILVWLKEARKMSVLKAVLCFNSILVWLKAVKVKAPISVSSPFQFHSGLIKSLPHIQPACNLSCFNSILVWLKVEQKKIPLLTVCSFNSILVWLKAKGLSFLEAVRACFNSILVWLKVKFTPKLLTKWKEFQFHSGLIKRSI